MTERELLRLHIEAVWSLTLPAIDESASELVLAQPFPPWSLYLGTFAQEEVALWRPDVTPEQRLLSLENARKAGDVWEQALEMRREVVFLYPLIHPEHRAKAQQVARLLTVEDIALLDAFEPEGAPHMLDPRKAPYIGVVLDGRLLSIAHSARQTLSACELGIDTLPEARRRGYAAAAVTLWTAIVQQQGLVPIYSAFAWNTASLQLARATGYTSHIDGVYGPVPEASE